MPECRDFDYSSRCANGRCCYSFFNSSEFANAIVSATEALLKSYRAGSEEGNISAAIWNVFMEPDPECCGMNSCGGFKDMADALLLPCCNITTGRCNTTTIESAGVAGCRPKTLHIILVILLIYTAIKGETLKG
ncbi:hypothetical protein TcWFU_009213 [Taenia crassiceps]|uniref:Uncharacterized protein n=1 Tax=Taenia crassiceps TaxID=6207 RepID=A0ABR4Q464_9CEST